MSKKTRMMGAEPGRQTSCPDHKDRYSRRATRSKRVDDAVAAARLRAAGVAITTVRYDGITHAFMMLNPLSNTHATRAAVAQTISILRDALQSA